MLNSKQNKPNQQQPSNQQVIIPPQVIARALGIRGPNAVPVLPGHDSEAKNKRIKEIHNKIHHITSDTGSIFTSPVEITNHGSLRISHGNTSSRFIIKEGRGYARIGNSDISVEKLGLSKERLSLVKMFARSAKTPLTRAQYAGFIDGALNIVNGTRPKSSLLVPSDRMDVSQVQRELAVARQS